MPTRRDFFRVTAAAAITASRMPRLLGANYELLIKGGRVIDPSQGLDRALDVAIACATANAARALPAFKGLGTLQRGAPADVAVFEIRQGEFEFVDNVNAKRIGRQKLVPAAVVAGGRRVL